MSQNFMQPHLASLGISRVADLTGLDTIGVPVWSACHPASRGLSVSIGKGLTVQQAWISAVMEAAEQVCAENFTKLVSRVDCRANVTTNGHPIIDLQRQSRCNCRLLDDQLDVAWVTGKNIATGESVFAPYELVGLDFAASSPWNRDAFSMSSLGLGAGASLESAILHALREVIEEDAVFATCTATRTHDDVAAGQPQILFNTNKELQALISLLERKGIDARFAEASSYDGAHVMMAAIFPGNKEVGVLNRNFEGFACRGTREAAAVAALLEAIQSRMTYISGARDDLWLEQFEDVPKDYQYFSSARFIPQQQKATEATTTPKLEIEALVSTIQRDGNKNVYVFDLSPANAEFFVARVLVDDMLSLDVPLGAKRSVRAAEKMLQHWRIA